MRTRSLTGSPRRPKEDGLLLEIPRTNGSTRQQFQGLGIRFTGEERDGKEAIILPRLWKTNISDQEYKRRKIVSMMRNAQIVVEDDRDRWEIVNAKGRARITVCNGDHLRPGAIELLCRYSIRLRDEIIGLDSGKLRPLPQSVVQILDGGRVSIWSSPKPIANVWAVNHLLWRSRIANINPTSYIQGLNKLWAEAEECLKVNLECPNWRDPGAYWEGA